MNLYNKTVLITGASSGLGYDLAKGLAKENCNLILLARRVEKLKELQKEISEIGGNSSIYECDISKKENVVSVFNKIFIAHKNIDIVILNSGVSHRAWIKNFNSANAEEIFKVNVLGMIYCTEAILPYFIKNKSGMIVGVSSLADVRGFPGSGFYCASKAAATTFLQSLRIEAKNYNIKVLTVKPGFVKTPMTDKNEFKMPFLLDVSESTKYIINGIKKEKRIIHYPFKLVFLIKILKLLPAWLFEKLSSKTIPKSKI